MWKESDIKMIARNKKALFDYEILTKYEAWIKLQGHEVKSIRQWHANLKGSYASLNWLEMWIKWMHITPWKAIPNSQSIKPDAERKAMIHKKDLIYLSKKLKEKWFSLVPIDLYFKWSLIKISVALVKWRKAHQKKQVLKERAMDKEAKIAMKKYI